MLRVYPTPAHDEIGTFSTGITSVPVEHIYLPGPAPGTLRVRATEADWSRIAVFGWHGSRTGFDGVKTVDAARYMAHLVVTHNAALKLGEKRIEYVLLEACDQGTPRVLGLWGTTNAKEFSRELNAELLRLGQQPVEVLAARDAGMIAGGYHLLGNAEKFSRGKPADFVTADMQQGRWDPKQLALHPFEVLGPVAELVGKVVAAVGSGIVAGNYIWDVVQDSHDDNIKGSNK